MQVWKMSGKHLTEKYFSSPRHCSASAAVFSRVLRLNPADRSAPHSCSLPPPSGIEKRTRKRVKIVGWDEDHLIGQEKKKKKGILIIHKTRDAQHSSHHQLPDAQADPKQNYCPPHSPANSLSFTVQQDIIWPVWASCPGSVPSQLLESPQAPSLAGHYEKLEKSLT